MGPFRLPMLGQHNVQNALAAVAIAVEMEIDDQTLRSAFAQFQVASSAVSRAPATPAASVIIDDYGHHPVEIAAVLKAARQAGARDVIAIVQPHRYSRLASLFTEFCTCMNDAGTVIVADVYAAGEQPIEGFDRDGLVDGLRASGHRSVVAFAQPGASRKWCTPSPSRAISSSASAPATSPTGPSAARATCRSFKARSRASGGAR